ncbi:hypothetical protein EYF80_017183 [Liparis tanakae]|uniref:Uncharacterized protein n=1 Tax=Liparis tanakae TaxID=230148 RepID=A0A4Z2I3C4_9TELE|nr:hypothetical protein EYF80_017183 [Liparis tanakae]
MAVAQIAILKVIVEAEFFSSCYFKVFLSVGSPRPAHEEAHLRATRGGEEKEKEKKQEETLEQEEEEEIGGERDGQSSYQPPASFTPSVNHGACRAALPSEREIKPERRPSRLEAAPGGESEE